LSLSIVRDVVEVQLGCLEANEATTITTFLITALWSELDDDT